jgi:hypothetical protein
MEADKRRKAYLPQGAISGYDVIELAQLDRELENKKANQR